MRMSETGPGRARGGRHPASRASLSVVLVAAALLGVILPATGRAREPAGLCHSAAEHAARVTGVPLALLQAIALAESGRRQGAALQPWPWAVNAGGEGRWLGSRAEAAEFLRARLAAGQRNLDVGCFQINYRWHGQAFPSAEDMLDPGANALYAARFLRRLHAEASDWHVVAGLFHSRTPAFAERYRARVRKLLAQARVSSGAVRRLTMQASFPESGRSLPEPGAQPTPLVTGAGLLAGSGPRVVSDGPRLLPGSLFALPATADRRPIVDLVAERPR